MKHLLPLAALPLFAVGCIYEAHDPYGTIAFDWQFDGVPRCADAGVDEVDLIVLQGNEVVLELAGEKCVGGGLELTDIYEGNYEVVINAYDRVSVLRYAGSFTIHVEGGRKNFAGTVNLTRVGEEPPPVFTGDLALFWGFAYPTNSSYVIDCDFAGADEVDVTLTAAGSSTPVFSETFACSEEGVQVTDLDAGFYELRITAFGRYLGDDVVLYDLFDGDVFVEEDALTDLGEVALPRVDDSFSDFDIAWMFNGESCSTAGVDTIELSIRRLDLGEAEDIVDVDCSEANKVRQVFVPGSYEVRAEGEGFDGSYVSTVTVDLPPSSVAQVDLALAFVD
jgi:hypothetical protein